MHNILKATDKVLIIGAGQAGGGFAGALRQNGFRGPITLVGDEKVPPYERPSLSKEMLLGSDVNAVTWLNPTEYYSANRIDLRLGLSAVAIAPAQKTVQLSNGEHLEYGALVLATGARPISLDIPGANNLKYLRTIRDSVSIRAELKHGHSLLVVGAGFIGLEIASAAAQAGCDTTVVDIASHPLARILHRSLARRIQGLHEERGIRFKFGDTIAEAKSFGAKTIVTLSSGEIITCDCVIGGIGVTPNIELAKCARLTVNRGIVVDQVGRTDDPSIFAIGDVAEAFNSIFQRHLLLESWQHAQNQGHALALALTAGDAGDRRDVPWFWSDQYSCNIQIYGVCNAAIEPNVIEASDRKSWLGYQLDGGKLVSAVGMNCARTLKPSRDFIREGRDFTNAELGIFLASLERNRRPAYVAS